MTESGEGQKDALAEELYNKTAELAPKDRVSVDEFVIIDSRAGFLTEDFDRVLSQIPDVEPERIRPPLIG